MIEAAGYLVAASPFLVAGVALLWLGWPAARAGAAALVTALVAAFLWPAFGVGGLAGAVVGGLGTVANVLYVLAGGLFLYNVLSAAGAIERVSSFLGEVEPDPGGLALVVVVGAAPFFESVTGFGVAVVISAPILLSAGFSPLRAAALASWGQLAVPWGALGVGTVIGADLAGVSFGELSDASAWMSLPLFPVYALAAVALAGGASAVWSKAFEAVLVGLACGTGVLLCSLYVAPELSGVAGGLFAVAAFLLPRMRRLREADVPYRALAPYAILLALLITASGLDAVEAVLVAVLGPVLSGPGTWLLVSAAFAALYFRLGRSEVLGAGGGTFRQWLPVAGAILTFILAGQVVAASGAAALLAGGAAGTLGAAYPVAAPLVGALGGALTGSNAGSNALFMPFQAEAATGGGGSTLTLAALQNVSGSQANLLAPQRVALAATATGLSGREAEIVRVTAPPVVISLAVLVLVGAFYG